MIQSIIDSQIEDDKMVRGLVQSDDHNDGPPGPADAENDFGGSSATRKMRGEVMQGEVMRGEVPEQVLRILSVRRLRSRMQILPRRYAGKQPAKPAMSMGSTTTLN
jgi:hypothetical protein